MSKLRPVGGIGTQDHPAHTFASPARRALLTLGVSLVFVMGSLMVALTVRSAGHVATVNLGTATSFAVLAGSAITNDPDSAIIGDVGLSPAAGSFIELTCLEVTGTIYAVDSTGDPCFVENAGLLTTAKNDLTTAYNDAAGRPDATVIGTELGGETLFGGVYKSEAGTFGITTGAGALTLDGQDSPDSVWIFQMASTLTTAADSSVNLINGADACNVFWQVGSSAALGTGSYLAGTVMADQSITVGSDAVIDGRALARVAAVTLIMDTINVSLCELTPPPTDAPTDQPTDAPTAGPTDQPTDQPTDAPTAGPTDQPSDQPTDAPTAGPTDQPTDQPMTSIPEQPQPDTGSLPPTSGSEGPSVLWLALLVGAAAATWFFLRPVTRVSVRNRHR